MYPVQFIKLGHEQVAERLIVIRRVESVSIYSSEADPESQLSSAQNPLTGWFYFSCA